MAKPPQDINLPDGSSRPQWATEETLLKLLDKFGGGSAGATGASAGKAGGGAPATKNPAEQLDDLGETAKTLKKNFGDMGTNALRHSSTLGMLGTAAFQGSKELYKIAGSSNSFAGAMGTMSSGMSAIGSMMGGPWGLALQVGAQGLMMLANKTKEYLDSMEDMVNAGLGYSSKLGESAEIAANSGLALKSFYGALKETGQAYRALGSNGMDAARAFGDLQTQVRDTYGTFGMSASDLAKGSADFINVFAATGAKGADAVSGAAHAYGKSLETLRKVSIATGADMNAMKKSLGDLLKSPVIINGLRAFGRSTGEAVEALARGASGFEAVFGQIGKELFNQVAEAQSAGLSIINTKLGQEIAPFADIQVLDNFQKKLKDNTVSAGEFGASAQAMVSSMAPNIPTLQLLAQQGDASAKRLLDMYNSAKKYTEMSTEELEAMKAKGRAEEKLKSISEKMGATFEKLSSKLFGFIDLIPEEMIDGLSDTLSIAVDVLGSLINITKSLLMPVFKSLGWVIGETFKVIKPVWAIFKNLFDTLSGVVEGLVELNFEKIWDSLATGLGNVPGLLWDLAKGLASVLFDVISLPFKMLAKVGEFAMQPFTLLWDWLKSSWLGRKVLGISKDDMASGPSQTDAMGNPVMGSEVSDASSSVVAAATKRESYSYGTQADVQKAQMQLMQDMADATKAGVAQQKVIADNTERTGKAVEQAGAYG
jgi:hypothetical protein